MTTNQLTALSWLTEEMEIVLKQRPNDLRTFKLLVTTEDDAKRLVELLETNRFFQGEIKNSPTALFFALSDMRQHKIDSNPMVWEEFEAEYKENPVNALQNLFWHEVIEQDVEVQLKKYFGRGKTLEDLYNSHIKNPHDNMFSIIL